ncbi:unnamed protein product [Soboliphyme baturini]|uniref:LSM14 domain-containing protein n=1 Tax=Soboliphyme baturini TaxID=241478 RepID=A0A183J4E9_9BILA|nr:unnamed protein product [Soboliphyme baturini]
MTSTKIERYPTGLLVRVEGRHQALGGYASSLSATSGPQGDASDSRGNLGVTERAYTQLIPEICVFSHGTFYRSNNTVNWWYFRYCFVVVIFSLL